MVVLVYVFALVRSVLECGVSCVRVRTNLAGEEEKEVELGVEKEVGCVAADDELQSTRTGTAHAGRGGMLEV